MYKCTLLFIHVIICIILRCRPFDFPINQDLFLFSHIWFILLPRLNPEPKQKHASSLLRQSWRRADEELTKSERILWPRPTRSDCTGGLRSPGGRTEELQAAGGWVWRYEHVRRLTTFPADSCPSWLRPQQTTQNDCGLSGAEAGSPPSWRNPGGSGSAAVCKYEQGFIGGIYWR